MAPPRRGFRAIQVREDAAVTAWLRGLDPASKLGRMLKRSYERSVAQVKLDFLHGEVVPVPADPGSRASRTCDARTSRGATGCSTPTSAWKRGPSRSWRRW